MLADEETVVMLARDMVVAGVPIDTKPAYSSLSAADVAALPPRVVVRICADDECGQEFADWHKRRYCSSACQIRQYRRSRRDRGRECS